ncbi:uncharacterized protein RHOBADRAFT_51860 [Rhodotorula graminis WP1]|uniref:Zn(2)-C6 fungal-type domain-containing protein n=1 Tax=Rhodotorula graminis (strain WP1) TaxID=578459 RepID=A0A194S8S3_RHOGW|nr:uncharacterized protein RHOBADRAFT_51860 [Rhodotorula graminis WP1]KPV76875.1 hypothetical protein RHOBADRAFT_51860 [Rhodotorula graminis WP1]
MSEHDQQPSQAGPVPRKTQRAPSSCTACTARKIKCDKVFPCKRCISKGIGDECRREVVQVKGRLVGADTNELPRREWSPADYQLENRALRRMIRNLTGKMPTEADLQAGFDEDPPSLIPVVPATPSIGTSQLEVDSTIIASDLTSIGIERPQDGRPTKRSRQASPDVSYLVPTSRGVSRSARLHYLLSLVPVDQSRALVDLSLRLCGWIHGALHRIPYLEQHDRWLAAVQRGEYDDVSLEWLSTYFAVIATGAYFLGDAWDRHRIFTPQQRLELPRAWFSAALEALYLSEFMTRHTFESLQTICILTLCANNFGASSHLVSLLHMGLHIAQARGLHVLGAEDEGKIPPPGLRKRELGRTVWGALELGIALSPAQQQPYSLILPQGFSAPQANLDEEDLLEGQPFKPRPFHCMTSQSVHILVNYLGRLVRTFNREFWSSPSLDAQWKLVQATDGDFVRLIDSFPHFKATPEPYPQYIDLDDQLPYLDWARHHMAVGVPRIRMTLHRCFLRKSYTDSTYLKSRQICLESARAILAERQRVVPALFDRAWHVTSDTVSAGIILVAIYREEKDLHEKRQLYADVKACIAVLGKGGSTDNNLVQIGVNLLNSFLRNAGSPPPLPPRPHPAATHSSASTSAMDGPEHLSPHPPFHPSFEPPIQRPMPTFDPSSPVFPPHDPSYAHDPYLSHIDPQLRASTSYSHSHHHPPPPPHDSAALPDLWNSLDFSTERRPSFDPFGGWEGSLLAECAGGSIGGGGGGGGVTWASTAPGPSPSGSQAIFPPGGAEHVEYDPSRPTAQW